MVPLERRRPDRELGRRGGQRGRLSDKDDGIGTPWPTIDLHRSAYHGGATREVVDAGKLTTLAEVTRCHAGTATTGKLL